MSDTIPTLEEIIEAIEKVASRENIAPQYVTRTQLRDEGITRYALDRRGGLTLIKNRAFAEDKEPDLSTKRGLQLQTNYIRKLQRKIGDLEHSNAEFLRGFENLLRRYPIQVDTKVKKPAQKKSATQQRAVVVPFSDMHYGKIVDPIVTPFARYGWTEASRRTARVVEKVVNYKTEHRDESVAYVGFNGDTFEGLLHSSDSSTDTMSAQFYGAVALATQAIDHIRLHFSKVYVIATRKGGNHDRDPKKHPKRALSDSYDSYHSMFITALMNGFRNADDVKFIVPKTPFTLFKILDRHLTFMTHGDTIYSNVISGSGINFHKVNSEMNKLMVSPILNGDKVKIAIFGHTHVPLRTRLENGINLIVNGSMIGRGAEYGMNAYNTFDSYPVQVIFESTGESAVGDYREIELWGAEDDPSYDELIIPPPVDTMDMLF